MPICGFKKVLVVCVRLDEAGCKPHRPSVESPRPHKIAVDSPRRPATLSGQSLAQNEKSISLAKREATNFSLNNAMKLPWRAGEWTSPAKGNPPLLLPPVTQTDFAGDSVFCLYNFSEKIGSGTYGTVYSASENCTGRHVAVKEIGSGRTASKSRGCNKARQEAKILETLQDCSSVVGFRRFFEEEGKESHSYIVMELCGGGDLETFTKENGPVSERQAGVVAYEVLNMLRSCHQKRILHGDVKAANFAIHSEIQQQIFKHGPTRLLRPGWLKGIDFGTCQQLGYGRVSKRVGTPTHWAPEVFGGRYCTEADMWSLGVLLYELMAGRNPFFTKEEEIAMRNSNEILKAIMHRKPDFNYGPWLNCSAQGIDFIKGLLMLDPRMRARPCEGLQHPWIKMHQTWRKKERPFLRGKPIELDTFIPCFS